MHWNGYIRRLHKTVDDGRGESGRTHRGSKSDEDINLLIQRGMDAEGSEGLRGTLAETNVAQTGLLGYVEDVGDGIGDVMPGEVVYAVVPKLGRVWVMVDRLLGVFVATIIAQPNVKPQFNEGEGEAALGVG